ncbi:hypothetical protein HA402_003443 [Bradysia odoriphaga]|nr:hypothetical protein HA402_003443 [Bradysia odoriphaga]
MLIAEIANRAELSAVVTSELREIYGIKYRRDKIHHQKAQANKLNHRKIFNTHLTQLELTDVVLTNGGITQIPVFVSDACQSILEQVTTEGLFRKAGSAARQREIKAHLDAGFRLEKNHHVIDVANVLKLFFRELPEPLLPPGNLQETILRSLLIKSNEVDVLMLTCLLLPPLSLNILMFFMQFLHTISTHSDENKMTIENLAIIFAPGIMPLTEMIGQRLNCHVKIIEMLIRNSNRIGLKTKKSTESSLGNKRDHGRSTDKSHSRKSTPRSTPRRNRNSHGINRRLKLRNALTPNKNSPRLSKRILDNELVNQADSKFNHRFASRLKIASSPDNSGRARHQHRAHSKSPNKRSNKKLTPVKLRSSPRLQVRNASNQELMPYL